MNLLQISNSDRIGGAARVAWDLHRSYNAGDQIQSKLMVGQKISDDPNTDLINPQVKNNVFQNMLDNVADRLYDNKVQVGKSQLSGLFRRLAHPRTYSLEYFGIDNFHQPGTKTILDRQDIQPDLIHFHNLHHNYFDLRCLPAFSNQVPALCTLHDCWMFTGHCAYYLDCDGWQKGCPTCPYLNSYPPIRQDNAAFNLRRKKRIYENSKLIMVTPSQWLMNAAEKSILTPAIQESKVIYNGVDQSIFHPMDQNQIRRELNIPENEFVLLFVANNAKDNVYKDYNTIDNAIKLLAGKQPAKSILFICIGSKSEPINMGNVNIRYIPFTNDASLVAKYYAASNLYLHAAKADNCPLVILEALSCGVPVIATAVGGIPELIKENETGYLIPSGDSQQLAEKITHLQDHPEKLTLMKKMAFEDANYRFSLQKMVNQYQQFYSHILENQNTLR